MSDDVVNKWLDDHKDTMEQAAMAIAEVLRPAVRRMIEERKSDFFPKDTTSIEKAKYQAEEFLEKWKQAGAAAIQIDHVQKKERKVRRYPAVIYDNHDGDTVSAAIKLGMGLTLDEKCRLRGINAPEMDTVKGKQARNHLHDLLEEYDQDGDEPLPYTMVEVVEGDERDKYGRLLVRIIGINPGESDQEVDINQMMIDNGQAVEYMASSQEEIDYEHEYQLLHDACWELFNAPKSKPLKSRLNAQEIKALEKIKNLISDN